jgi:hypothetical protein
VARRCRHALRWSTASVSLLWSVLFSKRNGLNVTSIVVERANAAEETRAAVRNQVAKNRVKAGIQSQPHALEFSSVDSTARASWSVPFSILPLDADTRAGLICDYISYASVMGFDRLQRALVDVGFVVECLLPYANGELATDNILVASEGRRRLTLHGQVVVQMLMELVDPACFAEGVREQFDRADKGSISLTFANERAVWRSAASVQGATRRPRHTV